MKKVLAIILAIALLCIIAVGTTLSYFTDTDYDTNTMTVGKVDIIQKINGNVDGLAEVKMYPVTINADDTLNNVVDLAVTVTMANDSENAYVRTVFAFEMMNVNGTWVNPLDNADNKAEVHLNVNGQMSWPGIEFEKNGTRYVVGVFTYGEMEKNTTTSTGLKQIYLASHVGNEFSDAVGGVYDILVLSQAVQAQGFTSADAALTAAFGEVNAANVATWFN